jgi:anti-sigma B factor antagonist
MHMPLSIESQESGGKLVVRVHGEVDLYSSPELRTAIAKAIPKAEAGVGVDLSGVEYMDSSGVATLVEGLRSSAAKPFVLVAPSQPVMNVLQLSRLDSVFDIRAEF